jgi:ribosomal protein S18 acetylase RimI-like enzyme
VSIEIVPIERRHIAGFHAVLDGVAREGRYLAFLEAPPLARVRRFVLNGFGNGTTQYVALDRERVVGWCDVTPKTHSTLRHSGILGMGVAATHRGQGLGTRLLSTTIDAAAGGGLTRIELTVRADNVVAIELYRRFGFEFEGSCRHFMVVGEQYYDALLMARVT